MAGLADVLGIEKDDIPFVTRSGELTPTGLAELESIAQEGEELAARPAPQTSFNFLAGLPDPQQVAGPQVTQVAEGAFIADEQYRADARAIIDSPQMSPEQKSRALSALHAQATDTPILSSREQEQVKLGEQARRILNAKRQREEVKEQRESFDAERKRLHAFAKERNLPIAQLRAAEEQLAAQYPLASAPPGMMELEAIIAAGEDETVRTAQLRDATQRLAAGDSAAWGDVASLLNMGTPESTKNVVDFLGKERGAQKDRMEVQLKQRELRENAVADRMRLVSEHTSKIDDWYNTEISAARQQAGESKDFVTFQAQRDALRREWARRRQSLFNDVWGQQYSASEVRAAVQRGELGPGDTFRDQQGNVRQITPEGSTVIILQAATRPANR